MVSEQVTLSENIPTCKHLKSWHFSAEDILAWNLWALYITTIATASGYQRRSERFFELIFVFQGGFGM